MTHGIKSLAQELPKYGRYNDDMVAHISSDEAKLLKSLGGSGTTNPVTGLPEFGIGGIGGGGGFLGTGINKNASDPVSNALSNNAISKGASNLVQGAGNVVDKGLVGLDKAVGKVIPGGWGTVGMVAGSAMGLGPLAMTTMGALNGSGVLRKGGNFNLQGAIMGGAMAYGMSELGEYARGASDSAAGAVEKVAEEGLKNTGSAVGASGINAATGELGSGLAGNSSGMLVDPSTLTSGNTAALNSLSAPLEAGAGAGLQVAPPPSIGSQIMSGNIGDAMSQFGQNISEGASNLGTNISEGATNAAKSAGNALDKATTWDTYKQFGADSLQDVKDTGSGIKNLLGAGDMTQKAASELARTSATAAGTMAPLSATGMTLYGGMGLSALDEQRKYLQDQANAGAISNAEYNASLADIERQADVARKIVAANPLRVSSDISNVTKGDSLYDRDYGTLYDKSSGDTRLYAAGGTIQSSPPDDQTGMANQSPMTNFMPSSRYTGSMAEENAAMQANQAAGIKTMGNFGNAALIGPTGGSFSNMFQGLMNDFGTSNSSNSTAQTPAAQTIGSPQSYYGGSGASGGINGGNGGNAFPLEGQYGIVKMAAGGMAPRFLSGGGDGMSDSIKANINGTQEARLADGEFVIPADVVSHLGNGSSKAGAKQLYSMMDRVRQARVGNKKQGKQINPRKFLAA